MTRRIAALLLFGCALVLGGCGDLAGKPKAEFLRSEAECAHRSEPASCRAALIAARDRYVTTAPQFDALYACEAEYGAMQCTGASSLKTVPRLEAIQTGVLAETYVPAIFGYVITRRSDGGYTAVAVDERAVSFQNGKMVIPPDVARRVLDSEVGPAPSGKPAVTKAPDRKKPTAVMAKAPPKKKPVKKPGRKMPAKPKPTKAKPEKPGKPVKSAAPTAAPPPAAIAPNLPGR